ncbi:restriction endonuclease subunit S [Rhizobium leguminosarum]|uniref:restriction endonuclease subunit S n=1 Tax=Rhizobium leguminosarum TaxID=384 RepID=UPI001C958B06|nr:restriction endonuclease subunit S [Rhizobium leguminosarum]MBY5405902.1 hypothetical protein [Rhizobium leguminosarum]
MSGLPRGWVEADFMEIIELHDAVRVPLNKAERSRRPGPYPYYGANGLVDHIDQYLFDGDYVLLAEDGGNFDIPGKPVAYQVGGKFWVNNHAHILKPKASIPTSFILHWCNNWNWMPFVGGTTRLKLTQEGMRKVRLAIPPLAEQKRIVAKLDALNAKSARARTELARIETLVSRYKQAVLIKAFSGELTRDWRYLSLGHTLRHAQVGLVRSKEQQFTEGGTPYVRMNHFDLQGRWKLDDITHVEASAQELMQYTLQPGDVLFNTRNSFELVGKVAYWEGREETFLYNNNILRMRFDGSVDAKFAFYQMQSSSFRTYLESVKSATTSVCAIYQKSLMKAPFFAPCDLAQQQGIVRRIESAFAKIDRLAAEARRALNLVGKLDEAILAKAFRGELVPQDDNDEPAEKLLERIRSERQAAPEAKRGRRKTA